MRKAPEHVIVELSGIHFNGAGRTLAIDSGRMMAFLCPACDDVHVVFQFDGMGPQFNMSLPPAAAEKLARLLTAPEVID